MRNLTYETLMRHPELLQELQKAAHRERSAAIGAFLKRLFKVAGRAGGTNPVLRSRLAECR